ncbi:MAG: hypothetical protein HRT80_13630 [Henriciella sp.]|nr:hypothetical protein [Henriciella sp.]
MADIFEEVEEGLRQDRLTGLWKKYGIFAYIAAALLIGGVAFNEYRQVQAANTVEENASRLEAALVEVDARNYESAATQLTELIENNIAPSKVAAHYLAGVRLDGNGDAAAAAEVLSASISDLEDPTEKLALIKSAYLEADTLSRSELEAILSPLTSGDGPFAALASELVAAKALQDGDIDFARREFNFLRLAQNAPPGVVTRAQQALAALPPISAEIETTPAEVPEVPTEPATEETTEETPE